MSMMTRRVTTPKGQPGHGQPQHAADPRFPEAPNTLPAPWPAVELRRRVEALATERFSGYLAIDRQAGPGAGVVLFYGGRPVHASCAVAQDAAALQHLFAERGGGEALCATHALSEGATLALASTFGPPQMTQPMGEDGGEVALLLRDLAGVKHSGAVQISTADSLRGAAPTWVRILMHEGKFLGVYSASDRQLKASLASVNELLAEAAAPQLTLFSIQTPPAPLALPAEVKAPAIPGATPQRDEILETDLVWFLSRFERAFGRLKERKDAQADILRAFGELTNELAAFVAALQGGGAAPPAAAQGVVAGELTRMRTAGQLGIELKLGKAGIDGGALAKEYGAQPKRSPAAAAHFRAASTTTLTLIERLLETMLGAFHDATAAGFAREGCETLLREVRGGLEELVTTPA